MPPNIYCDVIYGLTVIHIDCPRWPRRLIMHCMVTKHLVFKNQDIVSSGECSLLIYPMSSQYNSLYRRKKKNVKSLC